MEKNKTNLKNKFIKYLKKIPLLYNTIIFFYRLILKIYLFLIITPNYLFLRYKKNIKLHIGSGNIKIKDYINIDSLLFPNTDLFSNIKNLKYFIKKNSVSHIYASHVFEHFSHKEIKKILKLCYTLLRKKGELRISVPDIDKIVKIYYKNWEHFQTPCNSPWIGLIWGGQLTKHDYHKTGFNFCWMKHLLKQTNFSEIKEYDAKKFLEKYNIKDASLAKKPFGKLISLNIVAIK